MRFLQFSEELFILFSGESRYKQEAVKMKKTRKKEFCIASGLLALFAGWTVAVRFTDVQAIGPLNSEVGFATVNGFVHDFIGVNMHLYTLTDWLGLVPLFVCMGFAFFGLWQLIKRKSLFKIDRDILILGGFYVAVAAVYIFFEEIVINYRPVLIEGISEASYPSSTTMLVMCVMPTAIMQFNARLGNGIFKKIIIGISGIFTVFMVIGRLISGVHWFTDIVGGALFSAGSVMMYHSLCGLYSDC